jgi:hypothetical protein
MDSLLDPTFLVNLGTLIGLALSVFRFHSQGVYYYAIHWISEEAVPSSS